MGAILDAILNISTSPLFDFVTFALYESLCHILLKSVGKTLLCRSSHNLQLLTDYGGHLGRHLEDNIFPIVGFRGFLLCYLWSQILQKSLGKTLLLLTANNIVQCKAICSIGGHIRRHFEYITFPIVRFWYMFTICIVMSQITKIRWKNTYKYNFTRFTAINRLWRPSWTPSWK